MIKEENWPREYFRRVSLDPNAVMMGLRAPAIEPDDAREIVQWMMAVATKVEESAPQDGPAASDVNVRVAKYHQAAALRMAASTIGFAARLHPKDFTREDEG